MVPLVCHIGGTYKNQAVLSSYRHWLNVSPNVQQCSQELSMGVIIDLDFFIDLDLGGFFFLDHEHDRT